MEISIIQSSIIAIAIGAASGAIGSFVILRRMALVGDALSHVALPGIGLALAYAVDPFWGVLSFLLLAAVFVWWLEQKSSLPSEAIVGLLFTASLAVGILTIPQVEALEALFGEFVALPVPVLIAVVGAAVLITVFVFMLSRQFLFDIVSPELFQIEEKQGIFFRLIFYILFACAVAIGIKLVGTLLMGALTIIPASIAKNIARSMKAYVVLSACVGAGISLSGVIIAQQFGLIPGPAIILLGVSCFLLTLTLKRE